MWRGWVASGCIREFDSEKRVGRFTQQVHAPAVGMDVFLHDGQPDAGAAHRVFWLAFTTEEGLEHMGLVCRGHAGPLVGHVNQH